MNDIRTTAEVADLLGVSGRTVRRYAAANGIGRRFGQSTAFSGDDVERLRAAMAASPGAGRPRKTPADSPSAQLE